MTNHIEIKKSLLSQCADLINDKIKVLEKMTDDIQSDANNETKSSAGDKYETGRAMMQQERDKYEGQLDKARLTRAHLHRIKPDVTIGVVSFGAVVKTQLANYFIAISAGRMQVDGDKFYVISPQAPLAKSIIGKQSGDSFEFNDRQVKILEVF